ncbi:MAG: hypothetical protein E6R04_03650 [Spirochaetes bacterium]|nr:MAG: hypothetical protein E6R04_03650 [Spirochaetota bacterium]
MARAFRLRLFGSIAVVSALATVALSVWANAVEGVLERATSPLVLMVFAAQFQGLVFIKVLALVLLVSSLVAVVDTYAHSPPVPRTANTRWRDNWLKQY